MIDETDFIMGIQYGLLIGLFFSHELLLGWISLGVGISNLILMYPLNKKRFPLG